MKHPLALLVIAALLAGCGGGGEAEDPSAAPTSSTTSSATPAAPVLKLIDACPEVEAALPDGFPPSVRAMDRFLADVDEIYARGDLETQNALDLLIPGVTKYRDIQEADTTGFDYIDAEEALDHGVGAFAKRCKAVGSSALQ